MTSKTRARKRKRRRDPPLKTTSSSGRFPLFKELPKEVRLMIWEAALPGPRIVHVTQASLKSSEFGRWRVRSDRLVANKCNNDEEDTRWIPREPKLRRQASGNDDDSDWDTDDDRLSGKYPGRPHRCWGFQSSCSTPAMLLTCRESHGVASKVYSRIFGTSTSFPTVWFDCQQDTLYLHERYFKKRYRLRFERVFLNDSLDGFPIEDLRRVQNLAVHVKLNDVDEEYETWLMGVLGTFGNIKKFTVVNEHHLTPSRFRNEERKLSSADYTDLAFAEPIEFKVALETYERPDESGWLAEENLPKFTKPFHEMTNVNFEALDDDRNDWIKSGGQVWDLPEIEEKIIMTSFMKGRLEDLKEKFVNVVCKEPRYFFRHQLPQRQKNLSH